MLYIDRLLQEGNEISNIAKQVYQKNATFILHHAKQTQLRTSKPAQPAPSSDAPGCSILTSVPGILPPLEGAFAGPPPVLPRSCLCRTAA